VTYEDSLHGISVNYPANWTVNPYPNGVAISGDPDGYFTFVLYTETDLFGTLTAKDKLNMEMEELAVSAVAILTVASKMSAIEADIVVGIMMLVIVDAKIIIIAVAGVADAVAVGDCLFFVFVVVRLLAVN
jgi:hypothetical protein